MLDVKMLVQVEAVKAVTDYPEYKAFCAARSALIRDYIAWLRTDPCETFCTIELMGTQSAIRQTHDLITGRVTLGECTL